MEYEIERSAKSCAATGREFAPGEEFYSVLIAEGAELKRCDYSAAGLAGPAAGHGRLVEVADARPECRGAPIGRRTTCC